MLGPPPELWFSRSGTEPENLYFLVISQMILMLQAWEPDFENHQNRLNLSNLTIIPSNNSAQMSLPQTGFLCLPPQSKVDSPNQGPANYSLWVKSGPLPVFVNKVLLSHGHAHSLCVVYDFFSMTTSELGICERDCMSHKA